VLSGTVITTMLHADGRVVALLVVIVIQVGWFLRVRERCRTQVLVAALASGKDCTLTVGRTTLTMSTSHAGRASTSASRVRITAPSARRWCWRPRRRALPEPPGQSADKPPSVD
jgi:hypothetical protein